MEQIYLKKWVNVLLEWVNCLKLSEPIQNLKDLKDGSFFANLLKLIIPIDSDTTNHIFARTDEFLKKQYPHMSFNYDNENVAESDLIIICSLLLHYSCIHDRRDVLTSPLCYKLSKQTQTTIKAYLEKTKNDINRDKLFNIIETSFEWKKEKIPLNNFTLSCDYSNVSSPLQALLHTPVSKAPRHKEKDREINKLRSELDLERFEKIDLLKELSEEKDKNKNLSQQIHNKTTEITHLHNEISELETKIASNNCDIEWGKLQQKLKNENKSLEKYISQLHTEQEKILAEKDEVKEKMKKLQEECNFWQEKAVSYESKYENLSENYKQQQLELQDVRDNCSELSNLLEELQSTNRPNDSCDDDVANNFRKKSDSLSSTEDLACVVVEVQLRDVQKENIKLNKSLKDCQENIVKLNGEIHSFKIKIKELQGDKEILEAENEDLQSKVAMLITTRELLDRTKSELQETTSKLEDVSNHNEYLTTNVIIKDKQLIELTNSLQSLRNCNAVLNCNVQTLEEENKSVQSILRECSEKLHISNAECENSNKSFVELKSEITVALEKFEDFVFGVSKLDLNNFESSFSTILHELESDRIRQLKDKQLRAEAVDRLEKLVAMQKSQLVTLNEREQSYLTDIEKLTDSLKNSEEEVSVLEETISNYVNKIKSLNSTVSDMKLTQAELDMSKVGLEEKVTNLENQIQVYSSNEGLFKRVVSEICRDVKDQSLSFDNCLEILQLEIKNLEEHVETLTSNLDEARTVISQSNLTEEELRKQIKDYADKLQTIEVEQEETKEKLRAAVLRKKKLSKESKITKANYETEISSLKKTLENSEEQLVNLTSSAGKFEERIQENEAVIEQLKVVISLNKIELFERDKNIQSHQNRIKSLNNQNESLRKRNRDIDKECVNFERIKNQLEEKLKNLESHMENVVKELFSKNQELDAIIIKDKEYKELYERKFANLEENLSKTNAVINLQRNDLNDYKKQVSNLNQEIELLIDAENRCKSELQEVKNELNVMCSNYTETLQSHRELQADSESQINTLTENLHELIKKYNVLDTTHQDTIKQLQTSLEEYKDYETTLKEDACNRQLKFDEKEAELIEQLVKTKEKFCASNNSNEEMRTSFQQLCVAFAHEKLNAHKLLENLNVVRSTYKQLKNSFEELKCDLQSLPRKNSKCWSAFNIQLTDCFNSLNDENCILKKFKSDLQTRLGVLEDDCQQTKADLKKFQQRDEEITQENKSQKEALNVLIMEKEELQKEIFAERSKFNDLINDYKFKLNEFQEMNSVLAVDKCSLEERIKEISSLDLLRTKEILALESLINSKDDEIKVLLGSVGVKNTEVEELSTQNNNLESELSHLKEAFDSEVQKLNAFEQVFEKQNEIREELSSEVEKLKEKLATVFAERQALELEIKVAKGKITEYESIVRKTETDIHDVNTKLVTKLEEIVDLEKCKQSLQAQVEELNEELNKIIKEKDEITQNAQIIYEDAINDRTKLEKTAAEQHYFLMKQNEDLQKELDYLNQSLGFLQNEKMVIEMKLSNTAEENLKLGELLWSFKMNVQNLIHTLSETPFDIEDGMGTAEFSPLELENIKASMELLREKILRIKEQNKLNDQEMSVVVEEKLKVTRELEETAAQIATIENGRQQLLQEFNVVQDEKIKIENDLEDYKNLQVAHEVCKAKYEQLRVYHENNKTLELEDNLVKLENKVFVIQETYKIFAGHSKSFQTAIDKLINERNFLENLVGNAKYNIMCLQSKVFDVKDEREGLKLKEQIEAFEFIVEDLQKQFLQISKKIRSIILNVVEIPSKIYDVIIGEKFTETCALFDNLSFEEELEKITDCRDAANNLLEQVSGFEATLGPKLTKMNKENVLKSSSNIISDVKLKDEDLKKKNTVLKQRLTLSENAKSNLEKKIKQLRQENKFLQDKSENGLETGYKALLQQHIELKEKFEKIQSTKVLQENEIPKAKPKLLPDQTKQEKSIKLEQNKVEKEVAKLRNAYSNLMSENSRLNVESNSLKKLLEERTQQLDQLNMIKEAYEKLLEENNTFRMELDTIKYKRNKDKEALMEATKKIHDLKMEYEVKLEKMKEKTVQLYREEMNRENLKYHNEKLMLMKKLAYQQSILDRKPAPHVGKYKEYNSCDNESYSSGDSFFVTPDLHSTRNSCISTENLATNKYKRAESCKCSTLPKTGGMHRIAENQNHKRNPLHRSKPIIGRSLEMEDEDEDLFNNKYLADLKEGRCTLPSDRESNANRLSELKWRNSLYPPHLKSSYPAETQFSNLADFKEEDVKTGAFSDSMTTKLIQGDKPRKKDIGTTSYKKPGPPTPSKNGGRTSLQGNEREVLRENCGAPKRSTPSRLKHLFMGRSTSSKDNSENQPGTPRSKRLSIFRKQK